MWTAWMGSSTGERRAPAVRLRCAPRRCRRGLPPDAAHDGEPEAETTVVTGGGSVDLAQALEDERQVLGGNAEACITVRTNGWTRRRTPPRPPRSLALGVNFTALYTQVPGPSAAGQSGRPPASRHPGPTSTSSRIPLASAAWRTTSTAASRRSPRWSCEPPARSLPLTMRETSSRSLTSRVCVRALRSMISRPRASLVWSSRDPPRGWWPSPAWR